MGKWTAISIYLEIQGLGYKLHKDFLNSVIKRQKGMIKTNNWQRTINKWLRNIWIIWIHTYSLSGIFKENAYKSLGYRSKTYFYHMTQQTLLVFLTKSTKRCSTKKKKKIKYVYSSFLHNGPNGPNSNQPSIYKSIG